MWLLNTDRDILVNTDNGERIAIIPSSRGQQAALYGVYVQTPMKESLGVSKLRPEHQGFHNTALVADVPLDDCQNLLEHLRIQLNAWSVPQPPILEDEPQMAILTYTDHHKNSYTFICEDEITAERMLYLNVADHWPAYLGEIPEDEEQAIDIYYQDFAKDEARRIKPAPYVRWKDLRGKRR